MNKNDRFGMKGVIIMVAQSLKSAYPKEDLK